MTSVLVLGDLPATLEVTRSLGRMGHRIIVGTSNLACYANLSRYCDETWYHPSIRDCVPSFFEALTEFLETRPDVTVIFPTEDVYLVGISRNRDQVPSSIRLVMAKDDHIRLSDDKLAMHQLIDALDIPQAPYAVVDGSAELIQKCDEIGYPCVLLHINSLDDILGQKAIIIESRDHLAQMFKHGPDFDGQLLLRAFARGTRYNYYLVASEGRILDGVQMKITLTDRYNNTGAQVESYSCTPLPELTRQSEILLAHLNYTGPGMTQFLVDEETGETAFLEVNPRLGANCALARHAGIDLAGMAFELTCGALRPDDHRQSDYSANRRFAWLGGSLSGLRRDWREGRINPTQALRWFGRSIAMALRADAHICWRWDDPLPGLLGLCPNLLYGIRRRLGYQAKVVTPVQATPVGPAVGKTS